jgi:anti-sigma factor ChrR (cupin superfamily)
VELNADFSERVIVRAEDNAWVASPMPGVDRMMLDRVGDEVARATTIVRYGPNSAFSSHVHDGGEEFIVLEGVFSDEYGDFPAGSFIRNPPTSSHTPRSEHGATIFVKLWQFDPEDRTHVRLAIDEVNPVAAVDRPGVAIQPLFEDAHESARVETWDAGMDGEIEALGGAELLVLNGTATERGETLTERSWVRVPDGQSLQIKAGPQGVRFWLKIGHLRHVTVPQAR